LVCYCTVCSKCNVYAHKCSITVLLLVNLIHNYQKLYIYVFIQTIKKELADFCTIINITCTCSWYKKYKSRPLSTEKCNDNTHKWHAWEKFYLLRMSNSEIYYWWTMASGYEYLKKEFTTLWLTVFKKFTKTPNLLIFTVIISSFVALFVQAWNQNKCCGNKSWIGGWMNEIMDKWKNEWINKQVNK